MKLKIALFGTSADPPTRAHAAILEWLAGQFDQVVVWAADNPFKKDQTPLHHRQHMLHLLVQDLRVSHANVSLNPELSDWRTLRSVERAKQLWPTAQLTLVVGSDVVASLPHWYGVKDLLAQIDLLIVHRPGANIVESDLIQLQKLGANLAIADFTGPPISSTRYRQSQSTAGLTTAIADYIHRQGLYRWAETITAK